MRGSALELRKGMIATFDNPRDPYARWGKVFRIEGDKVWLSHIGWGYKQEIQAVQQVLEGVV